MNPLVRVGGIALLFSLFSPTAAAAHPLGNFTLNHYSRIEPAADGVRIKYVLDMAEIPTFQERLHMDADADGQLSDPELEQYADGRAEEIGRHLVLALNGAPIVPRLVGRSLSFPAGQGDLPTLRLEAAYLATLPSGADGPIQLTYRDENSPNRVGWREIVARPGAKGTEIQQSSVPAEDQSHELSIYPEVLLYSPLNVREARITFVPGNAAADPFPIAALPAIERRGDVYASLAATEELSLPVALFSLVIAMALGALHALSPGHGKTVVAAYLIGSRGTARHALFLGATVTATHTIGVYALGLVTLYLSQYVLPERLYPILQVVSGLLVIVIGGWLFFSRLRGAIAHHDHTHGDDDAQEDGHSHSPAFGHASVRSGPLREQTQDLAGLHDHTTDGHEQGSDRHSPPRADGQPLTGRSLLALGVSGGLIPCPSALVVLLSAIALHRVLFGLALIVAFSVGLAAVLVGIGLLLVYARQLFQRFSFGHSFLPRLLPVASALVIVVAGVLITVQALPQMPLGA